MWATLDDITKEGITTGPHTKRQLATAQAAVKTYLHGCVYDPKDPETREVLRDAVVAQTIALIEAGVGGPVKTQDGVVTGPAPGLIATSKSLGSASITYTGGAEAAKARSVLAGGALDPLAAALLRAAGLRPRVTEIR